MQLKKLTARSIIAAVRAAPALLTTAYAMLLLIVAVCFILSICYFPVFRIWAAGMMVLIPTCYLAGKLFGEIYSWAKKNQ